MLIFDTVQTESEPEVSFLLDNLGLREKQQYVREVSSCSIVTHISDKPETLQLGLILFNFLSVDTRKMH